MWSYMVISGKCALETERVRSHTSSVQGQAFLENLAHPPRGLAEPARRDARGAVEGAHEVGEIAEADVIGDIGDGPLVVGQEARRGAEPRADQILVRGHAQH